MTIKDIARLSGVSTATVSRVLNKKGGFSSTTEQRVLKVVKDNNFSLNSLAQGLVSNRSNSIGLIYPDLTGNYISELISGVEEAAQKRNISLLICNSEASGRKISWYIDYLKDKQVDGIISISTYLDISLKKQIEGLEIPLVLVSTKAPDYTLPYIKIDDYQAIYDGVCHLIEKGHRSIAMLSGTKDDPVAGYPRVAGYRDALRDAKIEVNENLIYYGNFFYESGLVGMNTLLDRKTPFSALVCASDEMAAGAYKALYKRGLKIPEDISIIGYDDTMIAKILNPGLTSINQPMKLFGERAVEILLKKERDNSGIILPHSIIKRESILDLNA